MNRKRRTLFLGTVIAIILLAIGGASYYYFHGARKVTEEVIEDTKPIAPDNGDASLTYSQAVGIFASTRISFDNGCNVTPETRAAKSGMTFMFDNRSRDALTFALDGTPYTLPGYGFKLLQLASGNVPHTVTVDCGPGQHRGSITLQ